MRFGSGAKIGEINAFFRRQSTELADFLRRYVEENSSTKAEDIKVETEYNYDQTKYGILSRATLYFGPMPESDCEKINKLFGEYLDSLDEGELRRNIYNYRVSNPHRAAVGVSVYRMVEDYIKKNSTVYGFGEWYGD